MAEKSRNEMGGLVFDVEPPTPTEEPPKQQIKLPYPLMPPHHPTPNAVRDGGRIDGVNYDYDDPLAGKGISSDAEEADNG